MDNDTHLKHLHQQYIDAKHAYLSYLRHVSIPKISEETANYVWDTQHWGYRYMFPKLGDIRDVQDKEKEPPSQQCKELYRKLVLLVHPDKCQHPISADIFKEITEAYNCNDVSTLQHFDIFYQQHGSFETYTKDTNVKISKEEEINIWEKQLWFQWLQPDSLVKKVFISPEELSLREKERLLDCDND